MWHSCSLTKTGGVVATFSIIWIDLSRAEAFDCQLTIEAGKFLTNVTGCVELGRWSFGLWTAFSSGVASGVPSC